MRESSPKTSRLQVVFFFFYNKLLIYAFNFSNYVVIFLKKPRRTKELRNFLKVRQGVSED